MAWQEAGNEEQGAGIGHPGSLWLCPVSFIGELKQESEIQSWVNQESFPSFPLSFSLPSVAGVMSLKLDNSLKGSLPLFLKKHPAPFCIPTGAGVFQRKKASIKIKYLMLE